MKENNNIDGLFKNKLEEHELSPPLAAWDKIDAELQKKTFTINWKWYAGMAASILLLFSSIQFFDKESKTPTLNELVEKAKKNKQILELPPEQMKMLIEEINKGNLDNVVVVKEQEKNKVNQNFLINSPNMKGNIQYYTEKEVKTPYFQLETGVLPPTIQTQPSLSKTVSDK